MSAQPRRSSRIAALPPLLFVQPKLDTIDKRVAKEMKEFDDADYSTEFSSVKHIDEATVEVTMKHTGVTYRVHRNRDILFNPPTITANGEPVGACYKDKWSPAHTSVRWLLMLAVE